MTDLPQIPGAPKLDSKSAIGAMLAFGGLALMGPEWVQFLFSGTTISFVKTGPCECPPCLEIRKLLAAAPDAEGPDFKRKLVLP